MAEEMTWKGEKIVLSPEAFAGIVEYAKEMNCTVMQFIEQAACHNAGGPVDPFFLSDAELLYVSAKYYYDNKNAQATPTKPA